MHRHHRRRCAAALVALLAHPAAGSEQREWRFTAFLGDREIGYHHFALVKDDKGEEIRSEARFDVRILFFDAYRYRHHNEERWRDGCLVRIEASTLDNDERYRVSGEAREHGFVILRGDERRGLPGCVRSFAYWNLELLDAPQLLNAQSGELIDTELHPLGTGAIDVRGRTVEARRYALRAGDLHIDLWYSEAGEWLALDSTTEGGRKLRYRLQ